VFWEILKIPVVVTVIFMHAPVKVIQELLVPFGMAQML
jgi:hypothetical protein